MDMQKLNEKVLSNGLTRLEHFKKLDFGQAAVEYEGDYRKIPDVPFGVESERQKYDVYLPKEHGRYPLLLRVHGGGWFMGHRADKNNARVIPFVEKGYVVISIGYRLANEAIFPGPVEDVMNAIRQILDRADEYEIDTSRIAITGGSSGTIEATLAALWMKGVIKAAFMEASILDFARITEQFKQLGVVRKKLFGNPEEDTSIEAMFLGASVTERPDLAVRSKAMNYIQKDSPAFMMIHGTDDQTTPYLQSVEFALRMREVTGDPERAQIVLLPGCGHGYTGGWNDPGLLEKKLAFLNKYL